MIPHPRSHLFRMDVPKGAGGPILRTLQAAEAAEATERSRILAAALPSVKKSQAEIRAEVHANMRREAEYEAALRLQRQRSRCGRVPATQTTPGHEPQSMQPPPGQAAASSPPGPPPGPPPGHENEGPRKRRRFAEVMSDLME